MYPRSQLSALRTAKKRQEEDFDTVGRSRTNFLRVYCGIFIAFIFSPEAIFFGQNQLNFIFINMSSGMPITRVETVKSGDHDKAKTIFTKMAKEVIGAKKLRIILNHPSQTMFGQLKEKMKIISTQLQGSLNGDQAALFNGFENIGNDHGPFDYRSMVARSLHLYAMEETEGQESNGVQMLEMGDSSPMLEEIRFGIRGSPGELQTLETEQRSSVQRPMNVPGSPVRTQVHEERESKDALQGEEGENGEDPPVLDPRTSIGAIEDRVRRALFHDKLASLTPGTPAHQKVEGLADETVEKILHSDMEFSRTQEFTLNQDAIDMCMQARRAVAKLKVDLEKQALSEKQVMKGVQDVETTSMETNTVEKAKSDVAMTEYGTSGDDESDGDLEFEEQKDDIQESQEKEEDADNCSHSQFVTIWKHHLNRLIHCSRVDDEDKNRQKETFYNMQLVMKSLRVHTNDGLKGDHKVSNPISKCTILAAMITGQVEEIPVMMNRKFYGNECKEQYMIPHGSRLKSQFKKRGMKVANTIVQMDKVTMIAQKFTAIVLWFCSDIIKELFSTQDFAKIAGNLNPRGSNWYKTLRVMNTTYSRTSTLVRDLETDISKYIKYDKDPKCMLSSCPYTKEGKVLSVTDLLEHFSDVSIRSCSDMLLEKWGCTLVEARWAYINEKSKLLGERTIANIVTKNGGAVPQTNMTKRILEACKTNADLMIKSDELVTDPRPYCDFLKMQSILTAKLFEYSDKREALKLLEELLDKPTAENDTPLIDFEIGSVLSVSRGTVSVELNPVLDFGKLKSNKLIENKISKLETLDEKTKFGKLMRAEFKKPAPIVSPKKPAKVRMPLSINNTSTGAEGPTNYEGLMHGIFATPVTAQSKDKLKLNCYELQPNNKGPFTVNVMDLIHCGLEHSAQGKRYKKLSKQKQLKVCTRLQKKTLQKMSEIMSESNSQINSTNVKVRSKKKEKREYKFVLAKDSILDARGKTETEWKQWVTDVQCVKCNKYGHYSPDCTEM